jgi:hypothetical protein
MTTGAFPERLSIVAGAQNDARAGQKARIHSGAISGKQRLPAGGGLARVRVAMGQ